MSVHHVDYDLSRPGQDYEGLIKALQSTGSWARPAKSAWLVDTTETSIQLLERLSKHVDTNDRLLVMSVTTSSWACLGLPKEITDWLKDRI